MKGKRKHIITVFLSTSKAADQDAQITEGPKTSDEPNTEEDAGSFGGVGRVGSVGGDHPIIVIDHSEDDDSHLQQQQEGAKTEQPANTDDVTKDDTAKKCVKIVEPIETGSVERSKEKETEGGADLEKEKDDNESKNLFKISI